jgi:hypothetical protein
LPISILKKSARLRPHPDSASTYRHRPIYVLRLTVLSPTHRRDPPLSQPREGVKATRQREPHHHNHGKEGSHSPTPFLSLCPLWETQIRGSCAGIKLGIRWPFVALARSCTTIIVSLPPPSPAAGLTTRDLFHFGAGAASIDTDHLLGTPTRRAYSAVAKEVSSTHHRIPTDLPMSCANHSRPFVCPALA